MGPRSGISSAERKKPDGTRKKRRKKEKPIKRRDKKVCPVSTRRKKTEGKIQGRAEKNGRPARENFWGGASESFTAQIEESSEGSLLGTQKRAIPHCEKIAKKRKKTKTKINLDHNPGEVHRSESKNPLISFQISGGSQAIGNNGWEGRGIRHLVGKEAFFEVDRKEFCEKLGEQHSYERKK